MPRHPGRCVYEGNVRRVWGDGCVSEKPSRADAQGPTHRAVRVGVSSARTGIRGVWTCVCQFSRRPSSEGSVRVKSKPPRRV